MTTDPTPVFREPLPEPYAGMDADQLRAAARDARWNGDHAAARDLHARADALEEHRR